MATKAEGKAVNVAEARAKGISQAKIDKFLQENPGDWHRLSSQEPDEPGFEKKEAAAPQPKRPAAPSPVPTARPAGGMPPPISAPIAGLTAATTPTTTAAPSTPSAISPELGQIALPEPTGTSPVIGALRQGLGTRVYPSLASPLAALKRIY